MLLHTDVSQMVFLKLCQQLCDVISLHGHAMYTDQGMLRYPPVPLPMGCICTLRCALLRRVLCRGVVCCIVLCCVVLCCVVLRCAVLSCGVSCCAVLFCGLFCCLS